MLFFNPTLSATSGSYTLVNRTAGRASSLFRRMSLALLYSHVDDALADSVSTSSYPQFTPINAQVHDVTNYLGWLKMQTAFPKAMVAGAHNPRRSVQLA